MRFHLVSLPHTQTTLEYSACAFTEKVRKFAIMMMSLGHEVILYGGDQNEAPCTEHVVTITEAVRKHHCGDRPFIEAAWDPSSLGWVVMNTNVIREIGLRKRPKDFICIIGGLAHKPIYDAFPDMQVVEFGIGYGGSFSRYRVFESYAWMHTKYGSEHPGDPNSVDGNFYDAVIPGYFDTKQFPYRGKRSRGDYYLFMGRVIKRKGYEIAIETCRHLNKKLVIAGQLQDPIPDDPLVTHVGVVGPDERHQLFAKAIATFVPTIYIEPFGNVAVESQACGTPVICTDWGAMTETVIEGVTGYHCRTLQEFVQAAQDAKRLNHRIIREHAMKYSLPVIAKQYDKYFRRLLTLWDEGWYALKGA